MLFLVNCKTDLKELRQIDLEENMPSSIYYNFKIMYSDSGILATKITGDTLKQYDKSETEEAKDIMIGNVHLLFFDNNGKVSSELKAQRAIRYRDSEKMFAYGNVEIFNELGEKMNTEEIEWDAEKKKIISNTDVKITKKDQILYGDSLISDQYFLKYEIKNPRGEFKYNE